MSERKNLSNRVRRRKVIDAQSDRTNLRPHPVQRVRKNQPFVGQNFLQNVAFLLTRTVCYTALRKMFRHIGTWEGSRAQGGTRRGRGSLRMGFPCFAHTDQG